MAEVIIGGEEKPNPQQEKDMVAQIKALKEMIEKNTALSAAINEEPRKVLCKTYVEGTPNQLKSLLSTMISNYGFDSKGNNMERILAVTLMVEDITPTKK